MSCGSCTGRGGASGNSVRLSLAGGRTVATYEIPVVATETEHADKVKQQTTMSKASPMRTHTDLQSVVYL